MPLSVYCVSIHDCYDVVFCGFILCLNVFIVYPSVSVMMWCSLDFCMFSSVYCISIDVCYDVVLCGYILCLYVYAVYPAVSVMMWCSVDTFCVFIIFAVD